MSRLKSLLMYAGLLGSLVSFACSGSAFSQTAPGAGTSASLLRGPEQRVALVIGNAHYKNAPELANPDNDAQAMAQFLNKAGFEVTSAIDLTQNDMIRVVQDFSSKVAARGPNSVAMVYYAGHGVQLAGENYLVPVDANVSTPNELTSDSLRLVDLMATLESIPSRMRIVLLDACRNNPFPGVNDAGRGLAMVDAPNGSIVGYSTAPGTEALDGSGEHSPYLQAFLNRAGEANLPIEQLFKRVRLDVAGSTGGKQIPWESSSLTSDFYFFGDTPVAATRAPNPGPGGAAASHPPSGSVQQAYDYVVSEGQPQYYQQFIEMYPHDPLCDRIRWLLGNIQREQAWHKAVIANSPFIYKTFADNFGDSQYAKVALSLHDEPKQLKQPINFGLPKDGIKFGNGNGQNNGQNNGQKVGGLGISLPGKGDNNAPANGNTGINGGKIVTLPVNNGGKTGLDTKADVKNSMPANRVITTLPSHQQDNGRVMKLNSNPSLGIKSNQGNSQPGKTSFVGNNGGGNNRMAMGSG